MAYDVADLTDLAGDEQSDVPIVELVGEVGKHAGGGDVDERDAFGVEHDRADVVGGCGLQDPGTDGVGVGKVKAALDAEHRDAVRGAGVGVAIDIAVIPIGSGGPSERRDIGPGGAVDQQQQRDGNPDEQAGERVEDDDAEQRGDRGDEVRPRDESELAAEPAAGGAIQRDERPDVDQLDHGRDHDRRERRHGQILE